MMRNSKIKVMVVDDSAFMRRILSQIVGEDDRMELVGVAKDGAEALRVAEDKKPDVITLDVEMPVMDGLTCLEKLLKQGQYSVVMVSSLTTEGANATIRALELGAVDFFPKPSNLFSVSQEDRKRELQTKILIAAQAKSVQVRIPVEKPQVKRELPVVQPASSNRMKALVALGISTGGPRALQSVVPLLPANLEAPVLIVQHMPPGFTKSLAQRLNDISEIAVKEAEDGDLLKAGQVYIAPGDFHIDIVKDGSNWRIKLDKSPQMNGFRPSADFLMNTVRKTGIKNVIGVIMTGMGGDGSKGLQELKSASGAWVIAQDEKSCSVFGMPRATIELGVVDEVVPLESIAKSIINRMGVYQAWI
jgi:two-component system, chemotaxis family, protein-glutamate methylesterase/glutaminase